MSDEHRVRPAQNADRGRQAERTRDMLNPGWKDVAWRVWGDVNDKNLFLASGGVTYAVLLALFPGLAALVSVYGLVSNPGQIEQQVQALSGVLPQQTQQMVANELHSLAAASSSALGISLVISVLVALWSASRGMSGLMAALNVAYGQRETRGFFRYNGVALALTIGTVVGGIVAIGLVGGLPAVVQAIGFGAFLDWLMLIVEWPLLIVLMLGALAVLYRYAPDRDKPQWQWVSPGAIVATALWITGSILFSVYVGHFGSYNKTYGSLGGAVVLMTWLYLTGFVVLLGGAVNAQAERQTRTDTATDSPQPIGERGASVADTPGKKQE